MEEQRGGTELGERGVRADQAAMAAAPWQGQGERQAGLSPLSVEVAARGTCRLR